MRQKQDFNLLLTRYGLERLLYRLSISNHASKFLLKATLDRARIALQIDIGFGDSVTPDAQAVEYPTLIAGMPAPTLRVYPKATVVAEKTHAISVLGMSNSRMKDFSICGCFIGTKHWTTVNWSARLRRHSLGAKPPCHKRFRRV
jgi:hypothetical protein